MLKLIFEYGFVALFGSARMLIRENERLRAEVEELRGNNYLSEFYPKHIEDEDDSDKIELTAFEKELASSLDSPSYGAKAPRFNQQKNTSDLINEARTKYEDSIRRQAEEQESELEAMLSTEQEKVDPEVRISKAKADYLVSKGRAIMKRG